MSFSKIEICNLALAGLGASPIRSFNDSNKRARMSDVFFGSSREFLLAQFDWPFARKYSELKEVIISGYIPPGQYVFALPADNVVARDILPEGSRAWWEVLGLNLYAKKPEVVLRYTASIIHPQEFSAPFSVLLAARMAVAMGPAITQDKDLMKELKNNYEFLKAEAWESNANIGSPYRESDEQPERDSFVKPEIALFDFEPREPAR